MKNARKLADFQIFYCDSCCKFINSSLSQNHILQQWLQGRILRSERGFLIVTVTCASATMDSNSMLASLKRQGNNPLFICHRRSELKLCRQFLIPQICPLCLPGRHQGQFLALHGNGRATVRQLQTGQNIQTNSSNIKRQQDTQTNQVTDRLMPQTEVAAMVLPSSKQWQLS